MRRILVALALLLVGVVAVAWLSFARDLGEAVARLEGRSEVVSTPFGAVEFAEAGTGTPLLMIHGSGGGFDQGLEFAGGAIGGGYRVIAPSRFGYLRSEFPENASPELQADALDALLDQLGEDEVVIVGGSAGALSAMQLAIRHPERCRGLVLMVPATYAPDRPPNTSGADDRTMSFVIEKVLPNDFIFWTALKIAPRAMTQMLLATYPALVDAASPAEQHRVADIRNHIFPVSRRVRGLFFDSVTAGNPPPYPLDRIRCPVLAISAEDDLFGTAQSARHIGNQVPGARLVIYPSGGHILVGHSEEVAREIAAFVAGLPTPVPGLVTN